MKANALTTTMKCDNIAGSLLHWHVLTEIFNVEVAVWPICVLDTLAACVLAAVATQQLINISNELCHQWSKKKLYNVLEFVVGRGLYADDQPLCHRGQSDFSVI